MKCLDPKKAQKVFSSVLSKIKPTNKEVEKELIIANYLIEKLKEKVPSSIEVKLAGSLAKGTQLKGKKEFDIFLLFPKYYEYKEIAMLGISYAKSAFSNLKTEIHYAQHPYLQIFFKNYKVDIVPAYKIDFNEEYKSAVDRSPLHTEYINANLNPNLKDDVRLLKQFTKNFDIYGAELRVEGFSGYLCELLILKYGSILNLFEQASEWKNPVIKIGKELQKEEEEELRKKFNSPMIFIDPVDQNRNVAAVVSQTSLSRFIFEARNFLKDPSERFFFSSRKPRTEAQIKAQIKLRGTACFVLSFRCPNLVSDVLWPQLKKSTQALVQWLSWKDFEILGYYYWSDEKECAIFLEFEKWRLPFVKKISGPSVIFTSDVDSFIKKHKGALNIHLEHDKIVAVEKRKIYDVEDALKSLIKNKEKIGITKGIEKEFYSANLINLNKEKIKKEYLKFLSDYFFVKIVR